MTTKRDKKKDEPKAAKRAKLNKEKLRDLTLEGKSEGVRGGRANGPTSVPW